MSEVCKYYLTLKGCRFGRYCRNKHQHIPSPWILATNERLKEKCDYRELSQYFDEFMNYFSYPHYFELTWISVLEMTELFSSFKANDFNVLLVNISVTGMHGIKWQLDLIKVCTAILEIITNYKPYQVKYWKDIIHLLWSQHLISKQDVIQHIIKNNNIYTKQLLTIYIKDYLKINKIPLLTYLYRHKRITKWHDKLNDIDLNYNHQGIHSYDWSQMEWKLDLNPQIFDTLLSYKELLIFMMNCSDLITFRHWYHYRLSINYYAKRSDVISELIIYYVWQDYYWQSIYTVIDEFVTQNHIDFAFHDILSILSQYVIDDRKDHGLYRSDIDSGYSTKSLIMEKTVLYEYIEYIDNHHMFMGNKNAKRFWKQYLLNHRCTKIFYKNHQ